uniref:Homeobox protein prospero n=1 Tax=Clastoptera arizonana TaxID=38151 RepID=A0A1B6CSD8_9HEMI
MDAASSDGTVNFDCLNPAMIRRGLDDDGSPPPGDIAHHMLRDILQGRKKELLALEQELRSVSVSGGISPRSPDNNNSINNNNNNNNNELKNGSVTNETSDNGVSGKPAVNGVNESDSAEEEGEGAAMDDNMSDSGVAEKQGDMIEDIAGSDSDTSTPSPSPNIKEEMDDNTGNKDVANKTDQIELKRARVENIVSSMRSSPSLPTQVNGCKKRKLYHPQQHDNSAAERYAGLGLNMNLGILMDDDDEEEIEPNEIRKKRVEKDALKNQLRTMQEQLAEMQQKYVQLCTRMDQESECPDNDEGSSDLEPDGNSSSLPEKPISSTPVTTPVKDSATAVQVSTPVSQPVMSPAISKMISAKLHSHPNAHMPPHPMSLPPNFNGALSLLQQQVLQDQHHQNNVQSHHHPLHHYHPQLPPHHAMTNAAAMYLGVNHKLYFEQEARLAKEASLAEQSHQQHLTQHHNHQQQIMNHHQQQQPPQQQQQQQHQHQQQQPPSHQHQPPQHQQQSSQTHNQPSQTSQSNPPPCAQSQPSTPQANHPQPNQQSPPQSLPLSKPTSEFSDRLTMLRNNTLAPPVSGTDLEGLADVLKTEITTSLSNLIDSIMSRFVQQRRLFCKQSEVASAAAEQLNKDLLLASQLLDRKSPRTKVIDRGNNMTSDRPAPPPGGMNGGHAPTGPPRVNGTAFPSMGISQQHQNNSSINNPENNINTMNLPHVRPSPNTTMFTPPKPPVSSMNSAAATAALYNSMSGIGGPHVNPFCMSESREGAPEQNEALSLVVAPKKKRHKVTDTRITPRTVSRILAQDGMGNSPQGTMENGQKFGNMIPSTSTNGSESPQPRPYHPPPPPMLPVSLPTSVAIPNPSLHESQVFSPYSPFYGPHHQNPHIPSASPPGMNDLRDSPPLHPPTLLHPALLAAAQHGGSPDYSNMRSNSGLGGGTDSVDRGSDCNSGDGHYDGFSPTSSTLTPMHLRKAKLMFFWVRYPSSAVLKMYFPDIKFNKNNTAQLVKWFSNFREFYYIQMEKYARQAVSEGVKNAEDLHVSGDCEIYRVLNLHYNRNNHIEVPSNFRFVVEQTLREFFRAIQSGKDTEQSWKKSIYKIISRMDDPVPEYFKLPNFLEQLE